MGESIVEQLTVPDDSTELRVKRPNFEKSKVLSGMVTTAHTNNISSGMKYDKAHDGDSEVLDDGIFRSKKRKEHGAKDQLLSMMSHDDFEEITSKINKELNN